MKPKTFTAWGIVGTHARVENGGWSKPLHEPTLQGRHSSGLADVPPHVAGNPMLMFATRSDARAYSKSNGCWFAKYRPVRITVTVRA